jgi:AMMECR1 domain-containing protein
MNWPACWRTTLKVKGELRGCCGTLEAQHPLATDVTLSAFQAAFRDPRFSPVAEAEFDGIRLEVSLSKRYRSPMKRICWSS